MIFFRDKKILIVLAMLLLSLSTGSYALQVIHGPYLYDMSETAVTVIWFTDVDCFANVEYGTGGSFNNEAKEIKHWLRNIGTHHTVRITGLTAGQRYNYRIISTEVTSYAEYPAVGNTIRGESTEFITFSRSKESYTFYFIPDIHNDANRLNSLLRQVNWSSTDDFVVLGGDHLTDVSSTDSRIYSAFIDPCTQTFAKSRPVVYVRGNHEMRGGINQTLFVHIPNSFGTYYFTFYHGPVYFLVFDSGEDKDDDHSEYGGLLRSEAYKREEMKWWEDYIVRNNTEIERFPFKIALVHAPNWGYGSSTDWYSLANSANVDLSISGHTHSYRHSSPGSGRDFHQLVVGQGQMGKITLTATRISVMVTNTGGSQVGSFNISAKR